MFYHVTYMNNLNSILKNGIVPKIGKRSKLIGESEPAVYLFTSIEACEDGLMNWLGDELDDSELVVIEIDNACIASESETYELVCTDAIEPHKFLRILDENLNPLKNKACMSH